MASQVQCPKCRTFRTVPHIDSAASSRQHGLALFAQAFGFGRGYSFENPRCVAKYRAGEIRARCDYCGLIFDVSAGLSSEAITSSSPSQRTAEERLKELEQLWKKGLLTDEEYKRKREAILRSL